MNSNPTVFIAGSMKIKLLHPMVKDRIDKIVDQHLEIVVGDASGADTSIQAYLNEKGATSTTVFCSGARPRNNVGKWPVRSVQAEAAPGTREFFTVKDVAMADAAHYGLMIWDAQSTGTLSNVVELLKRKKKAVVFVNKTKDFINVSHVSDLELLVQRMPAAARQKAEEKIKLASLIASLKGEAKSANERPERQESQLGLDLLAPVEVPLAVGVDRPSTASGVMSAVAETTLQDLRAKVNRIDEEVVAAIAKRFGVTREIGKLKAREALPTVDSNREAAQQQNYLRLAREFGIAPEMIAEIFRLVIDQVVREHDQR